MQFKLTSPFSPTGDQPQAIESLSKGVVDGTQHQTLLGVTGSGKTFTITGGAERYADRGVIPRALSYIFGQI